MKNIFFRMSRVITLVFCLGLGFLIAGHASATEVVLGVTQITSTKTYAVADNTFKNGWQWIFDVTVPTNETVLQMKFNDWTNGSNTIIVSDNMRFYSAQSENAHDENTAILVTSTATYGGEMNLNVNEDLDTTKPGRQIQIIVETKVPVNSAGGSYSTSYGIKTRVNPDINIPNPVLADYSVKVTNISGYASESVAQPSVGQISVGDTTEVGRWTFTEYGNEDLEIESITFKINGTINSDTNLTNWTLYYTDFPYSTRTVACGRTKLSNNGQVTINIDHTLISGFSNDFILKVDTLSGTGKYFSVSIANNYDIIAKGKQSGYYILPQDFLTDNITSSGWFKVQGPYLMVSKNTSVGNIILSAGVKKSILGSFKLQTNSSTENINLSQIIIGFATSTTYIENIGLYDGDTLISNEITNPTTTNNILYTNFIINKNQIKNFNIRGDIKDINLATQPENNISYISTLEARGVLSSEPSTIFPAYIELQTLTYGGTAQLKITNDSSVESKIILPSTTKQLIGISKYEAVNSDITLKKVTYAVRDGVNGAEGTAADFGDIELRKADGTVLATAPVVDSGSTSLVSFTGFSHKILAGTTDKLYLYAGVNASGVMTPASINTVSVYSDANTYLEAYSDTGLLSTANVGDANVAGADSYFCTSSPMLFHNTAPVIAKSSTSPSGTQTPSTETEIFRYTVSNPGTRDMYIATTSVAVSASGLGADGVITTFKLYDGNTLVATNGTTTVTNTNLSQTNIAFDQTNDVSSRLESLVLYPGETKTFKVTANTTAIRAGVSSGNNVYLTASLDGATGYNAAADDYETDWADGVIYYNYAPVNGSESATPYSASDSYDVTGNTLTF